MYQKRIAEIEARKAEIAKEIESADEARTKELDTEVDALNSEMATLRSKQAVACKLADPVPAEGETRDGVPADIETRAKQLRETRSVTIASGTLVQPKKTGGINENHPEVSSIVDQVNAEPCEGMGEYEVAYVISSGEGADTAEGAEAADTDPDFGHAKVTPCTITTYTGYINVPNDGNHWHFYLTLSDVPGSKAFVKLHNFNLVDADFNYIPGNTATESSAANTVELDAAKTGKKGIPLKAGLHPITITVVQGEQADGTLKLEWNRGPIGGKQTERVSIPAEAFCADCVQ